MIPEGWVIKCFADVADYKAGRTPARATSEYWVGTDDGVPWVTISDMAEFGVVTQSKERVTRVAFEKVFGGKSVPAGTLLMSFKLTIGRIATLGIDACHNEAIISIFPHECISQRYLGYFLAQVDYTALQDRQVKGNTLNREKLDRIEILLPPVAEQRSIADVLDLLRRSISLQDLVLAATQDLMRAAMRKLFTCGLRGEARKETEIGLLPESWGEIALGEFCDIISGGTPRKSVSEYWGGNIPWVSGKDLKTPSLSDAIDHVTGDGVQAGTRVVPKGSVLLLVRGMGLAKDLPVAVIDRAMAFNQDIKALVPRGNCPGSFVRSAIYASKERLLNRVVTSAHGTMTLNLNDVETFRIPYPLDPTEADELVEVLDAIDRKIELHHRKRAVLDDLFKALLHNLMTGKIRVSDLDISSIGRLGPYC